MNYRAKYDVVKVTEDRVFIVDLNGPVSVTNDADDVVAKVNNWHRGKRIIYRDSTGQWDELKHTNGRFDGFAPYNPNS